MTAKSRRISLSNTFTEDARWVDAGAEAFALHIAACCYSDRTNTDGLIDARLISRICLAVPPEKSESAAAALVKTGFWTAENGSYQIVKYLDDGIGFPAEEQEIMNAFWAKDKKRQRHCRNGVHDLCTDPAKCRYIKANGPWKSSGHVPDIVPDKVPDSLRLSDDPTLPNPTLREGWSRGGTAPALGASAPTPVQSLGDKKDPAPVQRELGDFESEEALQAWADNFMKNATKGQK